MARMATIFASLLLALMLSSYVVQALELESMRTLLQKNKPSKGKKTSKTKKETEEEKREREALEAYAKLQARRENERKKILKQASKNAEQAIVDFNKAKSEKEQINVFVQLWKNADGPTILKALTTVTSSSETTVDYYTELIAESIQQATQKGYSFQVAQGLSSGLTIVERKEDAVPLLNCILVILETRNKAKKGSGCTYVKNLMTDAELSAIADGYENEFTQVMDAPRFVSIMECFLDICEGIALDCCKDPGAGEKGGCVCDKKDERICDYNVFWRMPRTIWRCNGESCVTSKCLCPLIKVKAASRKGKTGGKAKTGGASKKKRSQKNTSKSKSTAGDGKSKPAAQATAKVITKGGKTKIKTSTKTSSGKKKLE